MTRKQRAEAERWWQQALDAHRRGDTAEREHAANQYVRLTLGEAA